MKRLLFGLLALCSLDISANAASRFGVCTTTCTWDSSSTAMWSDSSGGSTGFSVPGSGDTVTFDGSTCVGGTTCTITVNFGGTITLTSIAMGACTASTTGCIFDNSVNNNNMTLSGSSGLSISGSGTRNIKLGSATYTLSSNGVNFSASTVTNLTLSAASSTIAFTGNGTRNFIGGSQTYGTVTIGAASSNLNPFTFTGTSNVIGTLTIAPPNFITFPNTTTTITTLNCNGTSSSQILLQGANQTAGTINVAGAIGTYCGVWGIVFGSPVTATGFNFGSNTNATITAPGAGLTCILGGWLLWRDLPEHINDNFPAWLEKAA